MSMFDLGTLDLGNVPELTHVDPDKEYKLTITQVFTGDDKNGNPYLRFRMDIQGVQNAKDVGYFIGLPNQGMDAKEFDGRRRKLRTFLEAFGVSLTGTLDPESLTGREAWALLGLSDEGEYGLQNYVKRWVTNK